jgi:hypothetical protein
MTSTINRRHSDVARRRFQLDISLFLDSLHRLRCERPSEKRAAAAADRKNLLLQAAAFWLTFEVGRQFTQASPSPQGKLNLPHFIFIGHLSRAESEAGDH